MSWRNAGRIIKILYADGGGRYRAETVLHPKNPAAVGRKVRISPKTIDAYYRQQSH